LQLKQNISKREIILNKTNSNINKTDSNIILKTLIIDSSMGAQTYGAMMWVSPCEWCEQMVRGHAIDKVHRHMSLYELFGQSVSHSHKKNVEEKEQ